MTKFFLLVNPTTAAVGGDVTPPQYSSSEEGDVLDSTVVAIFNEVVNSVTNDYATGVTIKINAAGVTISSAVRQVSQNIVYYVITPIADANDTITFEYSNAAGDIADSAGNQLEDITAQAVTNNVGEHFRFSEISNGIHYRTQLTG